MALVGLIESLLTLTVVDEMTETRGMGNKECVAQGLANVTTGMFGEMGGCAMIGQSIINVSSGGRTWLSGIVAAVALLVFVTLVTCARKFVDQDGAKHLRSISLCDLLALAKHQPSCDCCEC